VFTRYATITFQYIAPLKNKHSLSLYLVCKILQSQHYSNKVLKLSINELKAKLGLEKKYVKVTQLKEYVLDVVSSEINDKTDLVFDYELHKTGKRFTDITLKFSQKKDISKQLDQPKRQPQEIEHQASDAPLNLDVNDQDIIIAAQLQSYGIPRNKALEYVTTYGVDTCKIGIEKLLGEIQKGRDIKNISGYLVSCIENAGNNSSSQEIKAAMDAEEKIKQDRKNQELVRFNEFDEYIYNNREPIATLLLRHQEKEKLIDDVEIDMLRCLKRIVNEYDDLASIHPYYLKLKFKDDFINYEKIQSVVDELEVASKEERIAKLKTDLEAKKAELEGVSGKAKGLVEKEITMLKVAIADLV
ncbi:replication initiation protein, partial [Cysteiniphilum marinum]